MITEKERAILHYGHALVRKRRVVDKKGVAIALIFLIAILLWAAWRQDHTSEQATWHEEQDLSGQITVRPAGKNGLDVEPDQPGQSLAGPPGALHDPRQGR